MGNYVIKKVCRDTLNVEVAASAKIGDVGGKICFDAKRIASQYRNLSEEALMVRLANIAFYEHVHHFQKSSDSLAENETEAHHLSAYVQITARLVQIPLLKWSPVRSKKGIHLKAVTKFGMHNDWRNKTRSMTGMW